MPKRGSFIDRHQLWPFYRRRKFSEETLEAIRWTEQKIAEGYVPPDDVQISRNTRQVDDGTKCKLVESPQYLKGRQRMAERGYDLERLDAVITLLRLRNKLPSNFKNHRLKGRMRGYRICNIDHDWSLIYTYDHDRLVLYSLDTDTRRNISGD